MFTGILTGFLATSRALHGSLLIDNLKFLSIFANSFSATPKSPSRIKGFTGPISISYNKSKAPHGFTAKKEIEGVYGMALMLTRNGTPLSNLRQSGSIQVSQSNSRQFKAIQDTSKIKLQSLMSSSDKLSQSPPSVRLHQIALVCTK